ncbi:MAG: domain containing protein [Flavipsychrobacter sp.]|nr:domain containing protein [Flavipsychrobacter sp.]
MNVDQLIAPSVPVLSTEDTGDRALAVMEENNLTQLPLVAEDQYIGLVQENELLEWQDTQSLLSTAENHLNKPAIVASAHPFEAIRIMNQMNLSILPVIDNERRYVGTVTKDTLLKFVAETSGIDNPGGIIVLEIAPRNYSLYEIARICENEDVMIINLQVHTNEVGKLEVTMKLNRTSLEAVVSSFERHDYHVKEVFGEEANAADIEGKYNLLMNYINM